MSCISVLSIVFLLFAFNYCLLHVEEEFDRHLAIALSKEGSCVDETWLYFLKLSYLLRP